MSDAHGLCARLCAGVWRRRANAVHVHALSHICRACGRGGERGLIAALYTSHDECAAEERLDLDDREAVEDARMNAPRARVCVDGAARMANRARVVVKLIRMLIVGHVLPRRSWLVIGMVVVRRVPPRRMCLLIRTVRLTWRRVFGVGRQGLGMDPARACAICMVGLWTRLMVMMLRMLPHRARAVNVMVRCLRGRVLDLETWRSRVSGLGTRRRLVLCVFPL